MPDEIMMILGMWSHVSAMIIYLMKFILKILSSQEQEGVSQIEGNLRERAVNCN